MRVRIHRERGDADSKRVRQTAYLVARQHKASALGRLLDVETPAATVVFSRTREEVDSLAETLTARGYRAEALHGGMSQEQRDRVMSRVRNQTADLLVATDVAARGLDIDHLTHVVNYDVPSAPDSYVHRIGRVGRAGREGVAITLVEPRQHRLLKAIEKATKTKIAVQTLPTVADLRARRLELTRAALESALADGADDQYRVVIDSLAGEYDLMEIALAAVRLTHEAGGAEVDEDIPDPAPTAPADRGKKSGSTSKIFISLGHAARIRPQDLVGAIANETSLSGRDIGAIEITHKYSTVEIPRAAEAEVVDALQHTLIKGRKARVERYQPPAERHRKGSKK